MAGCVIVLTCVCACDDVRVYILSKLLLKEIFGLQVEWFAPLSMSGCLLAMMSIVEIFNGQTDHITLALRMRSTG